MSRSPAPMPSFQLFAFPAPVARPPERAGWAHEIKYDGYRIQLRVQHRKARIFTRNGYDWTSRFPALAGAVGELPDCLLDGELCGIGRNGLPAYAALKANLGRGGAGLVLYLFDALWIAGEDLRERPFVERKARLRALLDAYPLERLRYVDHVEAVGAQAIYDEACAKQLEGIVSKRLMSPYRAGKDGSWLKTKCRADQELVIGGWRMEKHRRFGSLITGVYDDGALRYTGQVPAGYGARMLSELMPKLKAVETDASPFDIGAPRPSRYIHWTRPVLVAQVEIAAWDRDGKLRQASFKRLRDDKDPREVVREVAI
jgi:bifunctional non-homologous end joining protein LigD